MLHGRIRHFQLGRFPLLLPPSRGRFMGAYFVVLVMSRISAKRFKSEDAQDAFMDSIEGALRSGDFEAVEQACQGDKRALAQNGAIGLRE